MTSKIKWEFQLYQLAAKDNSIWMEFFLTRFYKTKFFHWIVLLQSPVKVCEITGKFFDRKNKFTIPACKISRAWRKIVKVDICSSFISFPTPYTPFKLTTHTNTHMNPWGNPHMVRVKVPKALLELDINSCRIKDENF